MPVTITPNSPAGIVGPGIQVVVQSDFVGPLPSTAFWQILFYPHSGEQLVYSMTIQLNENPTWGTPFVAETSRILYDYRGPVADGASVDVQAKLFQDNFTQLDDGQITTTWSATAGLATVVTNNTSGGGLTSEQATQLSETDTNVSAILAQTQISVTTAEGTSLVNLRDFLAKHTLDALTLLEITSGCTGDPVTADIGPTWYFGIIVRICTLPDWLTPTTPDANWYFPDLAVLTIFRGADNEKRIPIHTTSHLESPLPGFGSTVISDFLLNLVPPQTSFEVDWMAGVTGQVYVMKLP
jgi:hypothetical protein